MLCNASVCVCVCQKAERIHTPLMGDRREAITGLNCVSSGSGGHRNRISPTHDSLFIVLPFSMSVRWPLWKDVPWQCTTHVAFSQPHWWISGFFTLSWTYRSQILCDGLQLACVWGKRTANPVSSFWSGNIKSIQIVFFVNHRSKHSSNLGVWIMKKTPTILHYKQLYRVMCPLKVVDGGRCRVYTLIHWASAELAWGMEEKLGLISPLKSLLWEAEKMLRCSNSKQDKSIFVFYTIEESCSEENKVFVPLHSLLGSIVM